MLRFRTLLVTDKFIFVRNPKAASSSINHALQHLGHSHCKYHGAYHDVKRPIRFGVVRNPFDRMVSAWNHFTKPLWEENFYDWLVGEGHRVVPGIDTKRTSQFYWLDGCTDILRFENLKEDYQNILDKIGIGFPLPELNIKPHKHYRDVVCPKAQAIIEDRFAWEIRKFEYYY